MRAAAKAFCSKCRFDGVGSQKLHLLFGITNHGNGNAEAEGVRKDSVADEDA